MERYRREHEPTERSRDGRPDRLAELEEERDFLLRSLDDLDREHDAGDIDEADYPTLPRRLHGPRRRRAAGHRVRARRRSPTGGAPQPAPASRCGAAVVVVVAVAAGVLGGAGVG